MRSPPVLLFLAGVAAAFGYYASKQCDSRMLSGLSTFVLMPLGGISIGAAVAQSVRRSSGRVAIGVTVAIIATLALEALGVVGWAMGCSH